MARAQAGAKDPRRIAAVTREIDSEKMSIIEAVTAVDRHVEELKRCLQECAAGYSDSTLYAVRNVQFSRLTAMLGDGFEARPGLDDWRSVGVSGFRPLVVRCLGHVYRLAQARLLLEELQDPGRANPRGEDYVDLTNYVVSIDTVRTSKTPQRWSFLWDGEEVVSKILHSLDFLRTSAELSEWYGRSFFFTANPLMLPFPMDLINCVEPLDMTARIQQELTSRPWQLTAPRDLAHDWQYQAYLVHWCNSFNEICSERHSFNWPNLPNIKEDYDRNALYTAMLMLQCKCFVDIEESAERERKFITLSGTQRGAHLLVWETHNPPPKPRRYLLPENRKHVRVEDAVTKALEKRAAKLLLEHNATLGIFPDDPSLSSGSGSGSCVEQDAARDRQVGLAEYNNMVAEMMAANPIPAGVGTDTGTGKKIPLHKLKNSLNSNPVRSVRSSRLVIGTSADVAANKKALNVSNPDAIRQHTYKTLGNTGTDTDTGAGAGVGLQPQTAATRTAIVVPNRDDAVPGAVRLQQSSIRLAAGATLPVIGSKAKPAAGIGIGMGMPPASGSGSGSRARLRGDTMHAARSAGTAACAGVGVRDSIRVSASAPGLNQQQTQAHGQAQGQAQPQGLATMPSAAAAASEKRKSKFGKKLSILISSNLSSTAAGGSGGVDSPTAVRSAVTRVPRASIMTTSSGGGGSGSGTGRLTRRVTGRGSGTGPTSATFNAKSK